MFLVVAGFRSDAAQAKGLDALFAQLSDTAWGRPLVLLAALGFVVFAAYSFLEARYRKVASGA